jgi:hypothetical protein
VRDVRGFHCDLISFGRKAHALLTEIHPQNLVYLESAVIGVLPEDPLPIDIVGLVLVVERFTTALLLGLLPMADTAVRALLSLLGFTLVVANPPVLLLKLAPRLNPRAKGMLFFWM